MTYTVVAWEEHKQQACHAPADKFKPGLLLDNNTGNRYMKKTFSTKYVAQNLTFDALMPLQSKKIFIPIWRHCRTPSSRVGMRASGNLLLHKQI